MLHLRLISMFISFLVGNMCDTILTAHRVDQGYPKDISLWGNVPFDRLDAAFATENFAYFFCGKEYVRHEFSTKKLVGPSPISNWGLKYSHLDAALASPNHAYFFIGNEYVRY